VKNSRIRISTPKDIELMTCPSCKNKQAEVNNECEACGIIFSKYMDYSPIKARINSFLSPAEISDIRATQERFTKVRHDMESKVELIVHCHKEKLLDLAAHHLKKEEDKTGMGMIRKLVSGSYKEHGQGVFQRFINTISRPSIIIPMVLLILLMIMTIILTKLV